MVTQSQMMISPANSISPRRLEPSSLPSADAATAPPVAPEEPLASRRLFARRSAVVRSARETVVLLLEAGCCIRRRARRARAAVVLSSSSTQLARGVGVGSESLLSSAAVLLASAVAFEADDAFLTGLTCALAEPLESVLADFLPPLESALDCSPGFESALESGSSDGF